MFCFVVLVLATVLVNSVKGKCAISNVYGCGAGFLCCDGTLTGWPCFSDGWDGATAYIKQGCPEGDETLCGGDYSCCPGHDSECVPMPE